MGVHRARLASEGDAPHLLEQLGTREHEPLVLHEGAQELEFLEGEDDRLAAGAHLMTRGRQLDGAGTQLIGSRRSRRRSPHRWGGRAAQQGVHAGDELHHAEGLGQVVVGASIQAAHLVVFRALGREHHHRHMLGGLIGAQAAQNLQPVDARQHDVEQHQVGKTLIAGGEEALGVGKARGLEARLAQRVASQLADVGVVFDVVDHGQPPESPGGGYFIHCRPPPAAAGFRVVRVG